MYTYKLKFDNNNRSTNKVKNLDAAQALAVAYMHAHPSVKECEITTPTGALSFVRHTGEWHWNHPGFSFSMVQAHDVEAFRKMVR